MLLRGSRDTNGSEFQFNGRGVVGVNRLLWLEYEIEGAEGDAIRQRLEQHLLGHCASEGTQELSRL